MGPRAGRKGLTLQRLPACDAQDRPAGAAGQASGLSLHAGVAPRDVFAPNSAQRAWVTKAGRGRGARDQAAAQTQDTTPAERRASLRILACIEDPVVIETILAQLDAKAAAAQAAPPPCRAPPATSMQALPCV